MATKVDVAMLDGSGFNYCEANQHTHIHTHTHTEYPPTAHIHARMQAEKICTDSENTGT